eukprot:2118609-Rhodomonas_salina.1
MPGTDPAMRLPLPGASHHADPGQPRYLPTPTPLPPPRKLRYASFATPYANSATSLRHLCYLPTPAPLPPYTAPTQSPVLTRV